MKRKRSKPRDPSVYESRYKRCYHNEANRFTCFYCGANNGIGFDHVPPITRVDDYMAFGLANEIYVKVPACEQCNSLLGNSLQVTILDRVEFLKQRLRRKLARDLRCKVDFNDTRHMGPRLKAVIRAAIERRDIAEARLDYYSGFQWALDNLGVE